MQKLGLIVLVSIFGSIVSLIGCKVIRIEGEQLHDALRTQEELLGRLNIPFKKRLRDQPNKRPTQL
jgi:hypothetical protein